MNEIVMNMQIQQIIFNVTKKMNKRTRKVRRSFFFSRSRSFSRRRRRRRHTSFVSSKLSIKISKIMFTN